MTWLTSGLIILGLVPRRLFESKRHPKHLSSNLSSRSTFLSSARDLELHSSQMQASYQAIPLLDTRRKIYSASSVISSFPAPAILRVLQHSQYHNCCKKPSSGTLQSASFLPDLRQTTWPVKALFSIVSLLLMLGLCASRMFRGQLTVRDLGWPWNFSMCQSHICRKLTWVYFMTINK